jgi:hypothetical protein
MSRISAIFASVIGSLMLSACHDQPRSTSYFEANPKERLDVLQACRSGTQRGDECANAATASDSEAARKRRDRTIETLEQKIDGNAAR